MFTSPNRRRRRPLTAVTALASGFLLSSLLSSCTSSPPATTVVVPIGAPRIVGPLHTEGMRIIDAQGRPVRLMGIQVGGMSDGAGEPASRTRSPNGCQGWRPPSPTAYATIASWGFNVVRLSISWANLEPRPPTPAPGGRLTHHWNVPYLLALDRIVAGFTSRGLAVVIEMGQNQWSPAFTNVATARGTKCRGVGMPTWLYPHGTSMLQAEQGFYGNAGGQQDQYADAWRLVAARYARNPMVVGFDMMNEPYTHGQLAPAALGLDALYTRLGAAIRSVNPHALLIFQDSDYSPGQPLALSQPPPFRNEVYEFHLYTSSWIPDGLSKTRAYLARAERWDVPLWIGEFDAFGYASPRGAGPDWQGSMRQMMAFCRQHDISWSEFSFAPRWVFQPGTHLPRPGLLQTLRAGV